MVDEQELKREIYYGTGIEKQKLIDAPILYLFSRRLATTGDSHFSQQKETTTRIQLRIMTGTTSSGKGSFT